MVNWPSFLHRSQPTPVDTDSTSITQPEPAAQSRSTGTAFGDLHAQLSPTSAGGDLRSLTERITTIDEAMSECADGLADKETHSTNKARLTAERDAISRFNPFNIRTRIRLKAEIAEATALEDAATEKIAHAKLKILSLSGSKLDSTAPIRLGAVSQIDTELKEAAFTFADDGSATGIKDKEALQQFLHVAYVEAELINPWGNTSDRFVREALSSIMGSLPAGDKQVLAETLMNTHEWCPFPGRREEVRDALILIGGASEEVRAAIDSSDRAQIPELVDSTAQTRLAGDSPATNKTKMEGRFIPLVTETATAAAVAKAFATAKDGLEPALAMRGEAMQELSIANKKVSNLNGQIADLKGRWFSGAKRKRLRKKHETALKMQAAQLELITKLDESVIDAYKAATTAEQQAEVMVTLCQELKKHRALRPIIADKLMAFRDGLSNPEDRDAFDSALANGLHSMLAGDIDSEFSNALLLKPSNSAEGPRSELRDNVVNLGHNLIDLESANAESAETYFRGNSAASRLIFNGLLPQLRGKTLHQNTLAALPLNRRRDLVFGNEEYAQRFATAHGLPPKVVLNPVIPDLQAQASDYIEEATRLGFNLSEAIPKTETTPVPAKLSAAWEALRELPNRVNAQLITNRSSILTYEKLTPQKQQEMTRISEDRVSQIAGWLAILVTSLETELVAGDPPYDELISLMQHISSGLTSRFPDADANAGRANLFLRFLCPAEVAPAGFGLGAGAKDRKTRKDVSKVMQQLANGAKFGNKELGMQGYNVLFELPRIQTPFEAIGRILGPQVASTTPTPTPSGVPSPTFAARTLATIANMGTVEQAEELGRLLRKGTDAGELREAAAEAGISDATVQNAIAATRRTESLRQLRKRGGDKPKKGVT